MRGRAKGKPTAIVPLPLPHYTIYIKNSISAQELKLVDERLGSKQAIERIAMVKREVIHRKHMAEVDFEERDAILLQLRGQEQVERLSNSQLTDADLNRHLPDAGDAQKYIVCGILDNLAGGGAELRCIGDEP